MNLRIHRLAVREIDREVGCYEPRESGPRTELEDQIDLPMVRVVHKRRLG